MARRRVKREKHCRVVVFHHPRKRVVKFCSTGARKRRKKRR